MFFLNDSIIRTKNSKVFSTPGPTFGICDFTPLQAAPDPVSLAMCKEPVDGFGLSL